MSGSDQHDQVALVSFDNQAHIGGIVNTNILEIDFMERQTMLEEAKEVFRWVAQYMEPTSMVQRVCNHHAQIIMLQKETMNLKSQQFLPPQCDHTNIKNQRGILTAEPNEARLRPAAPRTDQELWEAMAVMTRDARHSGEEVQGVRTQLANALTLAARAAPAAPCAAKDRDHRIPDSLDFSWWDRTESRC